MTTIPGSCLEQDIVRDLLTQKQALLQELSQYEKSTKMDELSQDMSVAGYDSVPANTRLHINVSPMVENPDRVCYVKILLFIIFFGHIIISGK